jgi:DNA replication protein DnaC
MNKDLVQKLKALGLIHLKDSLPGLMQYAREKQFSYQRFTEHLIDRLYCEHQSKACQARLKRARIPRVFVLKTFPFKEQPGLDRRLIQQIHDSLDFIENKQNLIFIGPTGSGKTGLATSMLVEAVYRGYRGRYVEFNNLLRMFMSAIADQ